MNRMVEMIKNNKKNMGITRGIIMNEGTYDRTDFMWTFDDFESFVDQVSEVLKCPVTLEDINHNVLAYSNHENVKNSVRIKTIMGRHVPEPIINCLWKEGIIPTLLESEKPVRINRIEEIDLENRVAISIRNKKDVLGYIWAIEDSNKLLDEAALEFLWKSAKVISAPMVQYYSSRDRLQKNNQDFFWQLLLGNIWSHDEIKEKLNNINIYPRKLCTVIILRLLEEIESTFYREIINLLNTTQQIQIIFSIFNKKDFIVLVSMDPEAYSNQFLDRFIKLFISQSRDRFGIHFTEGVYGGIYERYSMIDTSYTQALTVLDIKEKFPIETQLILGYDELGIYQLINDILDLRKIHLYKNPFLKKLKDYDRAHNQRFLETLEVYLDCDCNTYETANSLHIHTNTLNYRLKRIREIGNIDLNNFNQKIGMYIDLKIEKLTGPHSFN